MESESLKDVIKRALPGWLRDDPDFRAYILDLTRREYAGRAETEDRFDALLAELRRDREEQTRKWDEHQAEQREAFKALYEQLNRDREDQNRKWEANQEELLRLHEEIRAQRL